MSKRYVLYLVLAALVLTAFSLALSRRDSRDWRANRSRRLFPFPWQDTVALTVAKPDGRSLKFRKNQQGEWQILLPEDLADTLNYRAIDEISALATLTWREPMAEASPPQADKCATLTAESAGGQKVAFAFGEIRNNLRAVCIDGDATVVYGVNQELLKFLDWPEDDFRNYYLASAGGRAKPQRIATAPAGGDPDLVIELKRDGNGWSQTRPVPWPVDDARLDQLLRWIERMRAESIEAEMAGDLEWFGFGPDSAFIEIEYDGPAGAIKRRVEFGKEIDEDRVYARVAGRNPVFALPAEVLVERVFTLASDHPTLWRNFYRRRALNVLGDIIPAQVTIERLLPTPATLTIDLVRDRDVVKWKGKLDEGGTVREFFIDPPDSNDPMRPLTALFMGLSNLRVKTFLADAAPGPDTIKWTAYPAWRFTFRSQDGTAHPALTVYSANAMGDLPSGTPFVNGTADAQELKAMDGYPEKVGVAFSLADRAAVMEMYGELSYLLCLPPYRYQSKKMLDLDPKLWGRIEIAGPDGTNVFFRQPGEVNEQWWLDSPTPEPLMDDNNRFVAMLIELSQLRSDGFVEDVNGDIANFGLDQPEITAIVYTSKERAAPVDRDGPLFKLTVGKAAPTPGTRYARLNDAGPVFLISGRLPEGLGDIYR